MSQRPSFLAELKRRNVYKVAVAYAVVFWLLIQIATQVFLFFEISNWGVRRIVLAIMVEFPMALAMCELMHNGADSKEVLSVEMT